MRLERRGSLAMG